MENLLYFVFTVVCLCATPGPDVLLIARLSLRQGFKKGAAAVLGVSVSSGVWGVLAALGLVTLISKSPTAFFVLKWAGAAYLAYLGVQTLWNVLGKNYVPQILTAEEERVAGDKGEQNRRGGFWSAFSKGFITDFVNPLAGVFVLTVFSQFLPAHADPSHYFLLLAFLYFASVLFLYLPLAYFASIGARILSRPQVVKGLDILSGLLFLSFAVELLLSAHFS